MAVSDAELQPSSVRGGEDALLKAWLSGDDICRSRLNPSRSPESVIT